MSENRAQATANDESLEAVVIGSGFGGSVAALRLGQAGYQTVVLERGLRWPITAQQTTFATYEHPDGRAAWLSPTTVDPINQHVPLNKYTGVLDRHSGNGITVLSGVGVGGGSLVITPRSSLQHRSCSHASFLILIIISSLRCTTHEFVRLFNLHRFLRISSHLPTISAHGS